MPTPRFALAILLLAALAASAFAQDKPRKVAFLVGVGTYDFKFTDLGKAPVNDVTELAKVLKLGGFEVLVLTSVGTGKDRATKANIEEQFKTLLNGSRGGNPAIKKSDTLLVTLCGHGIQAESLDPTTQKKVEQPFFCPADAKPDDTGTMVSLNGLIRATEAHGATTLFLVDACRQVPTDPDRTGIQGKKASLPEKTAVLFSCGRGQVAHQNDKLGHGLLTYAVLKTLRGEIGEGGDVTWTDLIRGVEKGFKTKEIADLIPIEKPQTPVEAKGELGATEPLVTTAKKHDTRNETSAPKPPDDSKVPQLVEDGKAKVNPPNNTDILYTQGAADGGRNLGVPPLAKGTGVTIKEIVGKRCLVAWTDGDGKSHEGWMDKEHLSVTGK